MKKGWLVILIALSGLRISAQNVAPFIKLVNPFNSNIKTNYSRQFISGSTCKACAITINSQPVKVYATGAFVAELNLRPGDTTIVIAATLDAKKITRQLQYNYQPIPPQEATKILEIDRIDLYPEGNLVLEPGDRIQVKVKTLPGATVTAFDNTPLFELPVNQTRGIRGIYQGTYTIDGADSFLQYRIPVTVTDSAGKSITRQAKSTLSVASSLASDRAVTKGRLAHLEYGLGDDRLGGAKIGYLDSNILLNITGKVGSHYRVQLAPSRTAYIPDELVTLLPRGSMYAQSLTDKITVYGDSVADYVRIGLFARLPYQSAQLLDPSRIVVDVFGATNNTNWITQLQSATEIKSVTYEQIADEIFRVTIQVKHAQHWGHLLYYKGNNLVVQVRRQPAKLALSALTIAVDAGHGGTNNGAVGPTGVYEKEITLALALKLQKALEKEGAKVIMTRSKEVFFDNKERILFYRDSLPDLLLSIHLNSSEDPIRVGGTSTYYRYIGFEKLSGFIYQHLLQLGLKDYGHTGSFNFMLNSPTEYPNALIETVFLSNPEEEMKILDEGFQQQLVNNVITGLKDFLNSCKP